MAYGKWGSGSGRSGGGGSGSATTSTIGSAVATAALILVAGCGGGGQGGLPMSGNEAGTIDDTDDDVASGTDGGVAAAVVTDVTFSDPNRVGEVGLGLTVTGGRGALNVLVAYSRAGKPFK